MTCIAKKRHGNNSAGHTPNAPLIAQRVWNEQPCQMINQAATIKPHGYQHLYSSFIANHKPAATRHKDGMPDL